MLLIVGFIGAFAPLAFTSGDDVEYTILCAETGLASSSFHGAEVGYRAKQLDFCLCFFETSSSVNSQSNAGHTTDVDLSGGIIDFRRTTQYMAMDRCLSGNWNDIGVLFWT